MTALIDDGLRRALTAAGIAFATFDSEGHATSANSPFAALFGTSSEMVAGRHLVGLTGPDHSPALTSALVKVIGGVSDTESLVVTPAGRAAGGEIRLTLAISHVGEDGEPVVFCIGTAEDPRRKRPSRDFAELDPVNEDADGDLTERLDHAIKSSGDSGYPFALLECRLGTSTTSEGSLRSTHESEMTRIAIARLDQRLRSTDSVIVSSPDSDSIYVLAEALGDTQDAAGVAYRLLSTMVEPMSVKGDRHFAYLTIGIAFGDGASAPADMVAAAEEALENALAHGFGGFNIVDARGRTEQAQL